jgi:RNA polymerase subunit RPABC4/transcription elongation factor Spt4
MIEDKNLCPKCRVGMLLFWSFKYKICINCHTIYPWPLDEGQKPLIQHQR